MKYFQIVIVGLVVLPGLVACGKSDDQLADAGSPTTSSYSGTGATQARLLNAESDTGNWLTHGRTYSEQRYSPSTKINDANVKDLGLAWYFDMPTKRGIEATPLVIDGVMYVTGSWSIVYAMDARNGKPLWVYDPEVPKIWGKYACCDVVNRGVAAWEDKVFVGTLDGYLVALDAATGEVVWRTSTIDRSQPFTITGAPRVVKGKVIIGNGGSEYGVRGYITAYDAASGEELWRFFTVPGNPADGFENEAMQMAAKTWTGEWWKLGGGGTVWDSMAYDPDLDLLYIGVGNGSPWNRAVRSPEGGDNLFLSSIVAVRPDTGKYVWHYQTTPGDQWDYTATQHMVLADIKIAGEVRKVIMQAPKNGFFYVLDRATGELISAKNFIEINWATGIDMETGRPMETAGARYTEGPRLAMPSPLGGHNWHPMAFNPETGLVYFSVMEQAYVYAAKEDFEFKKGVWNTGTDHLYGDLPEDPLALLQVAANSRGHLVAWDPVQQKEVWRYQQAGPWNGGALSTGGNLVFQGNLLGEFVAYSADKGERLWAFATQTGITAGPVTYELDGEQYVSVAVGWGTMIGLLGGPTMAPFKMQNKSRVLTFKLGADNALPAAEPLPSRGVLAPPPQTASAADVQRGHALYAERCMVCHGLSAMSGGLLSDLRYSSPETFATWDAIVVGGSKGIIGMPGYAGILSMEESQAIKAYVIDRAHAAQ